MTGKLTFKARTFHARTFASATWRGVRASRPLRPIVDASEAFIATQRGRGYVVDRQRGLIEERGRAFTTGRE